MPDSPTPARLRRAHEAVLAAMARPPVLWREYVLKGGLALQYAYGSPRRSDDLDFSALPPFTIELSEEKNERLATFLARLRDGLAQTAPRHGFARLTLARKRFSREIPALQTWFDCLEANGATEPFTLKVEVTLSERISETQQAETGAITLHVPVLEDVLAGKLKSLAQQPLRDTVRSSDVFDLWYFTTQSPLPVDAGKVARFLLEKTAKWDSIQPVTKARYHDPAVREYAIDSYAELAAALPSSCELPPFDDAFAQVLRFVDTLALPEDAT